jgi:thioredoxin reductase (NADPH)
VLIATGAAYRRLENPRLERFSGAGLYYTAPVDVQLLRGKEAVVVGGGNSAGQAVFHIAKYASRVTFVVRGDSLEKTMSDYLVQAIRHMPNVDLRLGTDVVDGDGEGSLQRITLRERATGKEETLPARLVFALIGADPHTEWLAGTLARDRNGFILTGTDLKIEEIGWPLSRPPARLESSMPGVYAVGDVRLGSVKRVASAAGEGSMAVPFIHEYLEAPAKLTEDGRLAVG